MKPLLVGLLLVNFVILISGCSSGPPKPVLPDGSNRVSINRELPVQSAPSTGSEVGTGS
jgi:hypothetical protein